MSKWANRLKGALATIEISATSLDSALTKADKTPIEVVSSAFVSGQSRDCSKFSDFAEKTTNLEKTKKYLNSQLTKADETPNVTERLNAMIAAGASFNVSTDDFQVCGADDLTQAEKDFLTINKIYILCTLQQGLLMKYLPLDLIPDYIFEVRERAAIQAFDDDTLPDPPFAIVRDVTKEWFADVLDEIYENENIQRKLYD